jgi:hypothetical protein
MKNTSEEWIQLKHGPLIPASVIGFMVDFEMCGFQFVGQGPTLRVIPPEPKRDTSVTITRMLTDQDREFIKKWKSHLLAVVAYEAPTTP